ncbi:MAG: hypothetical protein Q9225_005146 [Loekoesia sp. 1 TL-2023]
MKKVDSHNRAETGAQNPQDDPVPILPSETGLGKSSSVSPHGSKSKTHDNELVSGRCATCDSSVRWPSHLSVFRCTICLMVNDLQPLEVRSQQDRRRQSNEKPQMLSLRTTEKLANDCVLLYLQSYIDSGSGSPDRGARMFHADQGISFGQRGQARVCTITSSVDIGDPIVNLDLDSLSGMHTCRRGAKELHAHVPPASTSLPNILSQADLDISLPVDASSSPPGLPSPPFCAVPQQSTCQRLQIGQKYEEKVLHTVFRSLEDYIVDCFCTCDILNESFQLPGPGAPKRSVSEGAMTVSRLASHTSGVRGDHEDIFELELDAKTLLLGDVAENGDNDFKRLVDLIGGFVTHRLMRQRRSCSGIQNQNSTSVLVPDIGGPGAGTSARLHVALGTNTRPGSPRPLDGKIIYYHDWQIKAAAKVMSLLFQANDISGLRRHLPTSAFYNTLLDCCDLIADFETWETRQASFSFCQYPMFLSIWAKIRILEHDARRQMEIKARQAFFNSITSRRAVSQYLVLKVRRECLVEDSLRGVSEVVGSGQEDVKKGLRIAFQGEEGIDAGGTFETSDQFFLVGVVLGLAIYNSTILDVALPPFTFRKLLASAPSYTGPATSTGRPSATPTLADLAEFRPSLATGLQQLLEYNGDVQETFCRNFVADVDHYGQPVEVPLFPGGEKKAVTNANRAEFVQLYVKYLLDASVSRQFEPFKRGFFSVCGGNALSLFRPEEIELLVRGSDEPMDVATLRSVAIFDGWKEGEGTCDDAVTAWFWELFAESATREQKALLSFITGSDRLPAMGATSLIIRLTCLGDDTTRFPMARTCFNMIGLYRYPSKEALRNKLWRAVAESEGFGLK